VCSSDLIVDLRGKIVSILDLRRKLSKPPAEPTAETCIVILESTGGVVGMVVDTVSEVRSIAASEVEEPPSLYENKSADFLLGVAKTEEKVCLLLDIDKVVLSEDAREAALLREPGAPPPSAANEEARASASGADSIRRRHP
jgi:purine-binding chemotaxis protein CheW